MTFDGSLLQYGLPGLALGLVGGIITGIIGKRVTEQQHATLRTCLKYAVILLIVCAVAGAFSSVLDYLKGEHNPRITISVEVKPDLEGLVSNSAPLIETHLTPKPTGNLVDVSPDGPDSVVKVNVAKLGDYLKQLKTDNDQLHAQVTTNAVANSDRAKLFAAIVPTPPSVKSSIDKVFASAQPAAAADTVCRERNQAQCGWAKLATGDVQAASASFTEAVSDSSLPHDQVASATSGLGYTKLTEGKTAEAASLIKQAAAAGDLGATKQLNAVQEASKSK
ncbi:hypothetical protein [Dyella terrae]|uniref:hypothetical protein n=1 Tax=Dyella terrae TaxID=522259 RepID=UPI001EFE7FC0|nr:hypothetical protein [Dyella terrae]ULU25439.1 hypothetical protein DYST_02366 [Dyella terrae]